jgi:hypothetical protein
VREYRPVIMSHHLVLHMQAVRLERYWLHAAPHAVSAKRGRESGAQGMHVIAGQLAVPVPEKRDAGSPEDPRYPVTRYWTTPVSVSADGDDNPGAAMASIT